MDCIHGVYPWWGELSWVRWGQINVFISDVFVWGEPGRDSQNGDLVLTVTIEVGVCWYSGSWVYFWEFDMYNPHHEYLRPYQTTGWQNDFQSPDVWLLFNKKTLFLYPAHAWAAYTDGHKPQTYTLFFKCKGFTFQDMIKNIIQSLQGHKMM